MVDARLKGSQIGWRRHECKKCKRRFSTIEAPQDESATSPLELVVEPRKLHNPLDR